MLFFVLRELLLQKKIVILHSDMAVAESLDFRVATAI